MGGWDEVALSCFYHYIMGGEDTLGFVAYGGYVLPSGTVSGCTYEEQGCLDGIWLLLTEWSNHIALYITLEAFFPCFP